MFSGFMSHGIGMAVLRMLRKIQNSNIMLSLSKDDDSIWESEKRSEDIVEISKDFLSNLTIDDIIAKYLDYALDDITAKFMEVLSQYLNSVDMEQNIKFSLFAVLLVFISIIIWLNILNNLNGTKYSYLIEHIN